MIGVGSALRKARERRGITLDAASRDTKLHIDQLRALEAEDFEALLGDVYVRGSLRTYSQYLGLSPDKVIGAYARHAETPAPPTPPAKLGRVERAMAATRIRDNQRLHGAPGRNRAGDRRGVRVAVPWALGPGARPRCPRSLPNPIRSISRSTRWSRRWLTSA